MSVKPNFEQQLSDAEIALNKLRNLARNERQLNDIESMLNLNRLKVMREMAKLIPMEVINA